MTSHCAGSGHCTNERRVRKRDKKVRRDVTTAEDGEKGAALTCDGREEKKLPSSLTLDQENNKSTGVHSPGGSTFLHEMTSWPPS